VGSREPSSLPTAFCLLPSDVLDLLAGLVDKSLVLYYPAGVRHPGVTAGGPWAGGEARYHLLETVRQYAADRLRGSDDGETTRGRHRDFFLEWSEEIKPRLHGAETARWFTRMEVEHDNLRAALEWCRSRGEAEKELRLAVALCRFWDTHGHLREGRAHLHAALGRGTPDLPDSLRGAALVHAGWMAFLEGDHPAARSAYEQALTVHREQRDPASVAKDLNCLAQALVEEGEFEAARALFEEALALRRELGRLSLPISVPGNLGNLALRQGDYEAARTYLEEGAFVC